MRKSPGDVLRNFTKRRSTAGPEISLRGRAWLSQALHQSGLDIRSFAARHVYGDRSESNLVDKWVSGSVSPTKQSVRLVEKTLPGSAWVFHLPLWRLLVGRPLGPRETKKIASRCLAVYPGVKLWRFPGDAEGDTAVRTPPVIYPDVQGLVARGDLWGFIGAIIRVREVEALGEALAHCEASKYMFRALPGALRLPWLRPHAAELLQCLNCVRSRMFYSAIMYDVDEEVILRQADDPAHQPWREARRLDPLTHRFEDIEDPILPAQLIPGSLVRERVLAARRRKDLRASR